MITSEQYMRLTRASDEIAYMLGCNKCCEERCAFPDIGTGEGCPINEFFDRVENAIERRRR